MHLYRFLNKLEDLIFTFYIGRNRASYPETLANSKSPFRISVCFLPYHFPAFPSLSLTCLSRGPQEAVVWRSGSAAPLGICLAPPPPPRLRAGTVSMETAGCSAGSSACGAAGAGRGNQRASRPWRALEKASSVIAETGLKNVINLRHPGQRRSSQEAPSALASCRCDAATSTCFLLPCALCSLSGSEEIWGGQRPGWAPAHMQETGMALMQ